MKAAAKRKGKAKLAAVPVIAARPVESAAEVLDRGTKDLDSSRAFAMPGVRTLSDTVHGVLDDLDRLAHADRAAVVEAEAARRFVAAIAASLARMVCSTCCGELDGLLYWGGWSEEGE
jgi:hypothetical protein